MLVFGEPIAVSEYDLNQRNELTRHAREALLALKAADQDTMEG